MSGNNVKGAVKYLKVAAAVTMMASIGTAYTFGTVAAATVTVDSKIVDSSKETRVEASVAKKQTAKQKEDAKKKAEAKKKEEAKNNSSDLGIVVDFNDGGSGKREPAKEPEEEITPAYGTGLPKGG